MALDDFIYNSRRDYNKSDLHEDMMHHSPFEQFKTWFELAVAKNYDEPYAMNLCTIGNGFPSSRIVLMRSFDENGFTFFTNYLSEKGQQIAVNNKVALNFFWQSLEKQIRITGLAFKLPEADSDAYFKTRPRESQLGACASSQSQKLISRKWLEDKLVELELIYKDKEIPRPAYWGGYVVKPLLFEFWQGRSSRLHDRFLYELQGDSWVCNRLMP
ncbi:MAG: pyridoxamine 5'-phosphate oxidase [Bacteroidia bacterium]|nr:pyridoxamine 5'-phosphate oxidase [Bacteroidia bacterium]